MKLRPRKPIGCSMFGNETLVAPGNRLGFRTPVEDAGFGAFIDDTTETIIEQCRIAGSNVHVFWDLEGNWGDSYHGSPDLIDPEALPHFQRCARRLHAAGIQTGATLRLHCRTRNHSSEVAHVAPLVWGAKLYKALLGSRFRFVYVDSDYRAHYNATDPNRPPLTTAPPLDHLLTLKKCCPDIAFISEWARTPEHARGVDAFYNQTGPYRKWETPSTPPEIRAVNRKAWTATYVTEGIPRTRDENPGLWDQCVAAVRNGDTFFFHDWYGEQAPRVRAIYEAAA